MLSLKNAVKKMAVIAGAGAWLFIDSILEINSYKMFTLIAALAFFGIGIIQILNGFGIIGFSIPFLSTMVYNIIFVIEGILLIVAFFAMA